MTSAWINGIWTVTLQNNLPRLVAILVGDAPSVNEKYVPVYNAYNGQTETMEQNGPI